MTALRTGLKEVLPSKTELSEAPVATFFEGDPKLSSQKRSPLLQRTGAERGTAARIQLRNAGNIGSDKRAFFV